jgi:hypothetical protein
MHVTKTLTNTLHVGADERETVAILSVGGVKLQHLRRYCAYQTTAYHGNGAIGAVLIAPLGYLCMTCSIRVSSRNYGIGDLLRCLHKQVRMRLSWLDLCVWRIEYDSPTIV